MLIATQAFFYACGMFSGTISGLLGESINDTLGGTNTIDAESSLCDLFYERCRRIGWLEMGISHTYALLDLPGCSD